MDNAIFSDCGTCRFTLERDNLLPRPGKTCLFCMANPSTATATVNDPTITRTCGFAIRLGCSRNLIGNTNPYRSTDPKKCQIPSEELMQLNDRHLINMAIQADIIVIACGNVVDRKLYERALGALKPFKLYHLGLNKSGIPKHPLYLRGDTPLQVFREEYPA